jgi:hypothetical protein
MDLTKLLKARIAPNKPHPTEQVWSRVFLETVSTLLKKDLALLSARDTHSPFRFVHLHEGEFEAPRTLGNKLPGTRYLFIQIPEQAGILLEQTAQEKVLSLLNATLAVQYLTTETGESVRNPLFVAQSRTLEQFSVLDCETVRSSSGKTLFDHQFSEMLVSLIADRV